MKRLKLAFVLLILSVLIIVGFVLNRNFGLLRQNNGSSEYEGVGADHSMMEPHFIEINGEYKLFEVNADEANYFKKGSVANLVKPRMVYYGKNGMNTFVEGEKGLIDTDYNDVTLKGNVKVESDEGYVIESTEMKYVNKDKEVVTDSKVRIRGKGMNIKGLGMRVNLDSGIYHIYKNVVAVFDNSAGIIASVNNE